VLGHSGAYRAARGAHGDGGDGGVAGETGFVAGGAGAVGRYVVQMATRLGAARVLISASTPEKVSLARERRSSEGARLLLNGP